MKKDLKNADIRELNNSKDKFLFVELDNTEGVNNENSNVNNEINSYESSNLYRGSDVIKYTKDEYDKRKVDENVDSGNNIESNQTKTEDLEKNTESSDAVAGIIMFFVITFIICLLWVLMWKPDDIILWILEMIYVSFIITIIAIPFIILIYKKMLKKVQIMFFWLF